MKVLKLVSSFLSALLHPFFLPTIALFLFLLLDTHISITLTQQGKQFLLLIVFFNTAIVPMLLIYLLKRMKIISSISLKDRKDRVVPLALGAGFYVFNYFLLLRIGLPPFINFYFAGATFVVLAAFLITLRWKVSIHMMGIGAITAFFLSIGLVLPVNVTTIMVSLFLFSGAVGSARLLLKAHSARQVFAGYLVGFAIFMLLLLYVSG